MKAITIWQPYAQAIALGVKKFETRSWPTKYRGKLAIHASLKPLSKERKLLVEKYNIKDWPLGEVIAVADLVESFKSLGFIALAGGEWHITSAGIGQCKSYHTSTTK